MFIPEEKISEIQNAADIVEIVSESVILKNPGRTISGCARFIQKKPRLFP